MLIQNKNIQIKHSQITNKVRVSSAAIWYEIYNQYGLMPYYQYETWCFSDDPEQRSFQVIHGTPHSQDAYYHNKAITVHEHIVNNLSKKFNVAISPK